MVSPVSFFVTVGVLWFLLTTFTDRCACEIPLGCADFCILPHGEFTKSSVLPKRILCSPDKTGQTDLCNADFARRVMANNRWLLTDPAEATCKIFNQTYADGYNFYAENTTRGLSPGTVVRCNMEGVYNIENGVARVRLNFFNTDESGGFSVIAYGGRNLTF